MPVQNPPDQELHIGQKGRIILTILLTILKISLIWGSLYVMIIYAPWWMSVIVLVAIFYYIYLYKRKCPACKNKLRDIYACMETFPSSSDMEGSIYFCDKCRKFFKASGYSKFQPYIPPEGDIAWFRTAITRFCWTPEQEISWKELWRQHKCTICGGNFDEENLICEIKTENFEQTETGCMSFCKTCHAYAIIRSTDRTCVIQEQNLPRQEKHDLTKTKDDKEKIREYSDRISGKIVLITILISLFLIFKILWGGGVALLSLLR